MLSVAKNMRNSSEKCRQILLISSPSHVKGRASYWWYYSAYFVEHSTSANKGHYE